MNGLDLPPLLGIELFSGVGMLGEGLRAGFDYLGIPYRAVCHVEREAYAASVLVARMEERSLDAAPVWSDVTTFDAAAWRGKVDCIVAGFPCQDLSIAGRRAGLDGKRSGLFFEVVRIATDSGAWLMLLENVAGIATATASVVDAEEGELDERAASRVVGELADCGWNAEWITLSASDVGASHGRARWFCLAWRMGDTICGASGTQREDEQRGRTGTSTRSSQHLGDTGLQHQQLQQRIVRAEHQGAGCELGNAEHARLNATENREGNPAGNGSDATGTQPDGELARSGDSQLADTSSARSATWISGQIARDEGNARVFIYRRHEDSMADTMQPRLQRRKQPARIDKDGRTDGRSKMRTDQLANAVIYNFSHQDQTMNDGKTLSPDSPGSAQLSVLKGSSTPRLLSRRLNPYFVEWMMGWPIGWTSAIVRPASNAAAMESYHSALRLRLSYLLGEQKSSNKERKIA